MLTHVRGGWHIKRHVCELRLSVLALQDGKRDTDAWLIAHKHHANNTKPNAMPRSAATARAAEAPRSSDRQTAATGRALPTAAHGRSYIANPIPLDPWRVRVLQGSKEGRKLLEAMRPAVITADAVLPKPHKPQSTQTASSTAHARMHASHARKSSGHRSAKAPVRGGAPRNQTNNPTSANTQLCVKVSMHGDWQCTRDCSAHYA